MNFLKTLFWKLCFQNTIQFCKGWPKYIKDQCSKISKPKKVKCPKEKEKKETKYTLAFHAEGKNNVSEIDLLSIRKIWKRPMSNEYYVWFRIGKLISKVIKRKNNKMISFDVDWDLETSWIALEEKSPLRLNRHWAFKVKATFPCIRIFLDQSWYIWVRKIIQVRKVCVRYVWMRLEP